MALAEYNFTVEHRKGALNTNADAISRIPRAAMVETIKGLRDEQIKDKRINRIKTFLEAGTQKIKCYQLDDQGIVLRRNKRGNKNNTNTKSRIVVPETMIKTVLEQNHDNILTGGHTGITKTFDKISKKYYWAGIYKDIKDYCETCEVCEKGKQTKEIKAPLHPLEVIHPFETVFTDVIGPFPQSHQGNKYIVIFVCGLTKWVEAEAVRTIIAERIAESLFRKIICQHGCPKNLISDKATNYMSALFTEVCKLCQITKLNSTAFHPETIGQAERTNATLMRTLALFVDQNQRNWC